MYRFLVIEDEADMSVGIWNGSTAEGSVVPPMMLA